MKILIFAFDVPYPANRGGRADIWRRILALKSCGFEVFLVAWYEQHRGISVDDVTHKILRDNCAEYLLYPIRWGRFEAARRFLKLAAQPSHVSSRDLNSQDMINLERLVTGFSPDYIWSEGPYPAALAMHIASKLQKPFYYRSHNIESLYFKRQAKVAKGLKAKIALNIARIGLKKFEEQAISKAVRFYDVSFDDLKYWESRGHINGKWLPPIAESAITPAADVNIKKDLDIVFLGNLRTPNNVAGVKWLINEVMPEVILKCPNATCVIAGSSASDAMVSYLSENSYVKYIANPSDALEIYRRAKVLVNPVSTGSGIHVKALEMLMMNAPIITCTQGTQGMPDEVKSLFTIEDDASAFAHKICSYLKSPESDLTFIEERKSARKYFSVDILKSELGNL